MSPTETEGPRFTVEIERDGNGVTARCHGLLVAGQTELLHGEIKPLIAEGRKVTLDLTGTVVDLKFPLVRAFRRKDWLWVCAAARILITLQEGSGMQPLPRRHFNWRGGGKP